MRIKRSTTTNILTEDIDKLNIYHILYKKQKNIYQNNSFATNSPYKIYILWTIFLLIFRRRNYIINVLWG